MTSSESDDEPVVDEETNETTANESEAQKLGDFLAKPKIKPAEQCDTNDTSKELSRRERRNAYQRQWNARKKLEFEELKNKQVKGVKIILLNVNNTIRSLTIKSEDEYIKFVDDLLDTLRANQILNDFEISNL